MIPKYIELTELVNSDGKNGFSYEIMLNHMSNETKKSLASKDSIIVLCKVVNGVACYNSFSTTLPYENIAEATNICKVHCTYADDMSEKEFYWLLRTHCL